MTEMNPLRRRMIEDLTVRNLSPWTQRSYVQAVARFCRFFSRWQEKLGVEEVRVCSRIFKKGGHLSWANPHVNAGQRFSKGRERDPLGGRLGPDTSFSLHEVRVVE